MMAAIDANSREVDDTAHAALLAGLEQRTHSRCVDALRVLLPAVLEDTGAIDDRINAIEDRNPKFGLAGRCNIQSHPSGEFQFSAGVASEPNDLMSFAR
jgi:hypothetical protein